MIKSIECRSCGKPYLHPVETSIVIVQCSNGMWGPSRQFYEDMAQLTEDGWWWDYYDGLHAFCHDCVNWSEEWNVGSGDFGTPKRPYSLYTSREEGPPGEFLDEEES